MALSDFRRYWKWIRKHCASSLANSMPYIWGVALNKGLKGQVLHKSRLAAAAPAPGRTVALGTGFDPDGIIPGWLSHGKARLWSQWMALHITPMENTKDSTGSACSLCCRLPVQTPRSLGTRKCTILLLRINKTPSVLITTNVDSYITLRKLQRGCFMTRKRAKCYKRDCLHRAR